MENQDKESFFRRLKTQYPESEIQAIWRIVSAEAAHPADILERLCEGEPLQYILGYTEFFKRKFNVTNATLIPRPETEELCELAISMFKNEKIRFAEIGTGSGCISITLAAELPYSEAVATDISEDALHVAVQNAMLHHVSHKIEFVRADFLKDRFPGNQFNLIISNPPYISRSEAGSLRPSVLNYEPYMALFPPGHDALVFYKRLREFLDFQSGPCTLLAEINENLGGETLSVFQSTYPSELLKDMSGNDRFIKIKKEA